MNIGNLGGMIDSSVNAVGTEFGGQGEASMAFAGKMSSKVGAAYNEAAQQMNIAGPSKRGHSPA